MKWIIALLVSVGMFYTGYHHASRYEKDPVEPAPKPDAKDPAPAPAPVAVAPSVIPEPAPAEPTIAETPVETLPEPIDAPEMATVDTTEPAAPEKAEPQVPIDFRTAEARDQPTSTEGDQALAAALASGDWKAYRDYLRSSLTTFILERAKNSREVDALQDNQGFVRAHTQERFLSRFDQQALHKHFSNKSYAKWFLENENAMKSAYDQLTPKDDPAAVVKFLGDLFRETNSELVEFTNLAIACALVHDNKLGEATNRFFWYVKQAKDDRLFRDIRKMPVHDLCLVVDGVNLKELNWVQDEYRRSAPRTATGKVYADIKYRMDFVTGEANRDEVYEEYTLAQIKEHGGICGDQTHFAKNVCRALGIPAVGLSGSGDRGGHAWVGYQNADGTWATHGRYEDYANGRYRDPQTRSRVIESELQLRSEPEFKSVKRNAVLRNNFRVIDALTDAGELARATQLTQNLLTSNRSYIPGWEKLFAIYGLRRDELTGDGPLTTEEVIATIRDFEFAFKKMPDLLERADDTLTTTLAGVLDQDTRLKIIKRRRNRVESIDEGRLLAIIDLIRQEAEIYNDASDHDSITALYRRELRTGADDVQHFMKLADDYWKYSADSSERQKAALQLISSRVKSNFGDKLKSSDWFTKDTAIKPHAQLASFYRDAGESSRAEKIEKDLDKIREELREARS